MRVSDQAFYANNRIALRERGSDLQRAQLQAASLRRVEKPSDDPIAASRAAKERIREQRLRASERSLDSGRNRVDSQDSALGEVSAQLNRVKELAIQANSDVLEPGQRSVIAVEVRALRESILALANTRDGESFVFAGYASDAPAFDNTGAFLGDAGIPTIEVAEGARIPGGVSGEAAFGVGIDSVFDVLADLETAMIADDEPALQASLTRIDEAAERVILARSEVGGSQAAIDIATETVVRIRDHTREAQTELIGIDETDAFLELQRISTAYQSAVQIASQVPPPGLVSR